MTESSNTTEVLEEFKDTARLVRENTELREDLSKMTAEMQSHFSSLIGVTADRDRLHSLLSEVSTYLDTYGIPELAEKVRKELNRSSEAKDG